MARRDRAVMDALRGLEGLGARRTEQAAVALVLRATGHSQTEISSYLGVSQQTVSRWLTNARKLVDELGYSTFLGRLSLVAAAELDGKEVHP